MNATIKAWLGLYDKRGELNYYPRPAVTLEADNRGTFRNLEVVSTPAHGRKTIRSFGIFTEPTGGVEFGHGLLTAPVRVNCWSVAKDVAHIIDKADDTVEIAPGDLEVVIRA